MGISVMKRFFHQVNTFLIDGRDGFRVPMS